MKSGIRKRGLVSDVDRVEMVEFETLSFGEEEVDSTATDSISSDSG